MKASEKLKKPLARPQNRPNTLGEGVAFPRDNPRRGSKQQRGIESALIAEETPGPNQTHVFSTDHAPV